MKISIVILTLNRKAMLRQALDSALSQDIGVCEVETIVVDNGSTDGTLDMLASDYPGVRSLVCSEPGSPSARNTAIAAAGGEWIAFLDDDDVWAPGKIARFAALARDHPEARFLYSAASICDFELNRIAGWPGPDASAKSLTYTDFLRITITPSVVALHREVFEKVGIFDPTMLRGQEIDYFCRVLIAGFSCAYTPEELTRYRLPERPNPEAIYRSYGFVGPLTQRYLSSGVPGQPPAPVRRAILRHVRGWHSDQLMQCRKSAKRRGDYRAARRALYLALRVSPLHALKGLLRG